LGSKSIILFTTVVLPEPVPPAIPIISILSTFSVTFAKVAMQVNYLNSFQQK